MRKLRCAVMVFVWAGFVSAQEETDPLEGVWLSLNGKGDVEAFWEVFQNEGLLCGRILSAPALSDSMIAAKCKASYDRFPVQGRVNEMPVLGTPWIFGLRREEAGKWSGGSVIDPSSGRIYKCQMTYHSADGKKYQSETLEMRGEIALGIGASQNWRRATREEAITLR